MYSDGDGAGSWKSIMNMADCWKTDSAFWWDEAEFYKITPPCDRSIVAPSSNSRLKGLRRGRRSLGWALTQNRSIS